MPDQTRDRVRRPLRAALLAAAAIGLSGAVGLTACEPPRDGATTGQERPPSPTRAPATTGTAAPASADDPPAQPASDDGAPPPDEPSEADPNEAAPPLAGGGPADSATAMLLTNDARAWILACRPSPEVPDPRPCRDRLPRTLERNGTTYTVVVDPAARPAADVLRTGELLRWPEGTVTPAGSLPPVDLDEAATTALEDAAIGLHPPLHPPVEIDAVVTRPDGHLVLVRAALEPGGDAVRGALLALGTETPPQAVPIYAAQGGELALRGTTDLDGDGSPELVLLAGPDERGVVELRVDSLPGERPSVRRAGMLSSVARSPDGEPAARPHGTRTP